MAVRAIIALLSLAPYCVALFLPAHSEVGIDFGSTYTGFECLMMPVNHSPLEILFHPWWLANPAFLAGIVALWRGKLGWSAAGGALAMVIALAVWDQYRSRPAYWLWLSSMIALTWGACVLFLVSRIPSKRAA